MMGNVDVKLAIDGGGAVREKPFPPRRLFGDEEKAAAVEVFDEAISTGEAFGYGGKREQEYEKEFAECLGGGFAKAVNSGTSASRCTRLPFFVLTITVPWSLSLLA